MAEEEQREEAQVTDAEGSEDGEGEEGGKKNNRLMIIIAAAVLLLVGGGVGLYFSGILGGGEDAAAAEHAEDGHADDAHGDGHDEQAAEDDHGATDDHAAADDGHGGGNGEAGGGSSRFLEIPPMIVNLNTDDGTPRYLRLSIQLELANPSQAPAVQAVMPRVIDQFQTYLRELRVRDLRGSSGIYRLQMELLWRVNRAAAPVKVKDVLFQEILIQ